MTRLGRPLVLLLGLVPGLGIAQVADLSGVWINPGFYSYHFDRDKGLNDRNPGIGIEWPLAPMYSFTAGLFHNSDRVTSHYIGVYVMPLEWKGVKFGAAVGGFDGYQMTNNGGWFPAIIPTVAFEGQHWGLNVAVIPEIKNRLYGAITFQLKYRFGAPPPPAAAEMPAVSGGSGERP